VLDHQSKAGTMRQPAAALGEQGQQGQQGQQLSKRVETERAKSSQRRSRVYEARLHGVPGIPVRYCMNWSRRPTLHHSPPLPTTPQAAASPSSRHY
jgi:hypothetical protein